VTTIVFPGTPVEQPPRASSSCPQKGNGKILNGGRKSAVASETYHEDALRFLLTFRLAALVFESTCSRIALQIHRQFCMAMLSGLFMVGFVIRRRTID